MARVSIRVDDELKTNGEMILEELGLSMSSAFVIFLKQVIRRKGLPFPVTLTEYERNKEDGIGDLLRYSENNRLLDSTFVFTRDDCYE